MSNTWVNITPMGTRRSCLGIAGYDGLVRLSYFNRSENRLRFFILSKRNGF
jgi:hypothetical protein